MSKPRLIVWVIIGLIFLIGVVQIVLADKYEVLVNVEEGERIIGINPSTERLDFGDLSRKSSAIRYITLENKGERKIKVIVWKFGEISNLIKVSKSDFVLEPGQEERLEFVLYLPLSARVKKYSGQIWILKLPII